MNKENFLIKLRIDRLKKQLSATDYKTLKFFEGLITEEEYAPIKAKRQELRNQINELEAQLKSK